MAVEKMTLLKVVGSNTKMNLILKNLIVSEKVQLSLDENHAYDNSYIIHEYESEMKHFTVSKMEDPDDVENDICEANERIEIISKGLDIELKVDKSLICNSSYGLKECFEDSDKCEIQFDRKESYGLKECIEDSLRIEELVGKEITSIHANKDKIERLNKNKEMLECILDKSLDFSKIQELNYFDYEIGTLTKENKVRVKKNYENISAIILKIGIIKEKNQNIYITLYPKQFKKEMNDILVSLDWNKLNLINGFKGNVTEVIRQIDEEITELQQETRMLEKSVSKYKEEIEFTFSKIHTNLLLEKKVLELQKNIMHEENVFCINVWVRENDKEGMEKVIKGITDEVIIVAKSAEEVEGEFRPPTKFKNNWFAKPFETIVKLYGVPSYKEIDPTPILAITFCLMFGIMFGDIGQGAVYFLAGVALYKKIPVAGQILTRLGVFSIAFGFVYGSLFGLEQHQLPWLPSLIGAPLDPKNIMPILACGVIFGVVVLTISYVTSIINALFRYKDIEEGLFGKNGIAGYVFFINLVLTGVSFIVPALPMGLHIGLLLISLLVMIFKHPLASLVTRKDHLFEESIGEYFTESIFEGVETILGALSNAISFIRIGAFALNHAGLFMAFLVMSDMTESVVLKFVILILGNILILSLEGLVVFIQCLRLQYYESFSKHFHGDGVEYDPISID